MKAPDPHIQQTIDRMTQCDCSFALYRLPWTDEPIFILQEDGPVGTLSGLSSLNRKKGFVLAPFQQTGQHPAVLIRPDSGGTGWETIGDMLSQYRLPNGAMTHNPEPLPSKEEQLKAEYEDTFSRFIAPLRENKFQKLVLSRKASVTVPGDFSPTAAFVRACNSYPRMMISLCHTPLTGTWLGSTPEIILDGQAEQWHTVALAGTMPMKGEVMPAEWDEKNRKEQAFVSQYIYKVIRTFGTNITENGPYTARAGQVVHLKTDFRFSLKDTDHLGDLLNALHPTPAVCGLPKEETYRFILENEGYDRHYYSGIIGWLDPQDDTHLYVNLRCMNICSRQATLFAGGGILPSSTAETEWEETQHKMDTMRNIL